VEQDHRRVKFRVSAMLGFKSFQHARRVLAGIELIEKLKKGQYGVPLGYPLAHARYGDMFWRRRCNRAFLRVSCARRLPDGHRP
jgi:hypothetical protein